MPKTLEKIEHFLAKHHLLSLATCADNRPQSASLFYAYDDKNIAFIVASDFKTEHIQNIHLNTNVSGTVALETDEVGKIQGLQFTAKMYEAGEVAEKIYYKAFPYAKVMQPKLWSISLKKLKFTDNRLGFGKKLYWNRADFKEFE